MWEMIKKEKADIKTGVVGGRPGYSS